MCRKSYYHHKSQRGKHGHWMAGNMERWAKHNRRKKGWFYPPVNVQELDDRYEVFLFAPGLTKEDFEISLKDNFMTIKAKEQQEAALEEGAYWKRKEFSAGDFKRTFELNEKIDLDSIKAKYENGVLRVTLSKLEGEETLRKDIFVA